MITSRKKLEKKKEEAITISNIYKIIKNVYIFIFGPLILVSHFNFVTSIFKYYNYTI